MEKITSSKTLLAGVVIVLMAVGTILGITVSSVGQVYSPQQRSR